MNTNKRIYFGKDIFKDYTKKPRRLIEDNATTEKENCSDLHNKNPKHLVTNLSVYYPKEDLEIEEFQQLGYKINVFDLGKSVILETCLECQKVVSITIRD